MRGAKLAVLSDVHLGPTVTMAQLEKMVQLTNHESPAAILFVGDLMDGYFHQFPAVLQVLSRLRAKYGVYYATGNHEYYLGEIHVWLQNLESIGIQILQNSHTNLGGGICLIGLDDISAYGSRVPGHGMDINKAMKGCDHGRPRVVMAHHPKAAELVVKGWPGVDLVVSGHTHAGQIYVLAPLMYYLMPFYHGLYKTGNGSQVFVSAGVYYWGTPMKMVGMAEIPILTLV